MKRKEREIAMAEANLLTRQGQSQKEIAEQYGVTDRTIRNWLRPREKKEKPARKTKLDTFKTFVDSCINNRQDWNAVYIFSRLKSMGYTGGITILREYLAMKREELNRQVEIRFETMPGLQAQVDWKEFGRRIVNGREQKLYAFVMILGYSRMPYVRFTTSMKESVLLDCHAKAFLYFGGVPQEILYDNMKTAWLYSQEQGWKPNPRLLGLSNHYGFTPKRCQVRRAKTKGKVERFIRYINGSFWPQVRNERLTLEELDEKAFKWLHDTVGPKVLREFNESRDERFLREKDYLGALPAAPMDCRELRECLVSRESFIALEGKRYSVPPVYIGRKLSVRLDILKQQAEIYDGSASVRRFHLASSTKETRIWIADDREKVMAAWEKRNRSAKPATKRKIPPTPDVEIRPPSFYDGYAAAASL